MSESYDTFTARRSLAAIDNKTPPTKSQVIEDGLTFAAGSINTSASAGSSESLHIDNPAGNNRKFIVSLVTSYTDNSNALRLTFLAGGTSSGAELTPVNLLRGEGALASSAVVKFGSDALSGATALDIAALLTERNNYELTTTIVVMPGESLAVQTTIPGTLSSSEIAMNVVWSEVSI